MKPEDFEAKMRKGEWFHSLRVPEGMWTVVRLDGRGFTKMTKELGFEKPFDQVFHRIMVSTTADCMTEFQGVFATTHSDEISILFPPYTDVFDREVEKIVSTTASSVSVAFSSYLGDRKTFDSRIWIGATIHDVIDYFVWRMEDALRGSINSWSYWTLRQQGNLSKAQATRRLEGKGFSYKNEMLFSEFGINFNDIPSWQKRGTGLYFSLIEKVGHNPLTNEDVTTLRRVLHHEDNLPIKADFRDFLHMNLTKVISNPSEMRGTFIFPAAQWNTEVCENP